MALVAIAALVVGVLIGGAVGFGVLAADVRNERDDLQQSLAEAEADQARAEEAAAAVESKVGDLEEVVAVCQEAAPMAKQQIEDWNDFWADELEWLATEAGSDAEAELDDHMLSQYEEMADKEQDIMSALDRCVE